MHCWFQRGLAQVYHIIGIRNLDLIQAHLARPLSLHFKSGGYAVEFDESRQICTSSHAGSEENHLLIVRIGHT